MSFPPTAAENEIRRRPAFFSFLSFGSGPEDTNNRVFSPSPSGFFDKIGNGSLNQGRFDPNQVSLAEAAKSRLGKTIGVIVLFLVGMFLYLSPSSPLAPYLDRSAVVSSAVSADGTCSVSWDRSRPVTQYALMIDAGSTGSRIHVYEFSNCQQTPQLVREVFEMTKPGLSSYPDDPVGAAKSLDVLLEVAMKEVPDSIKACTPVAVKATAGLRILGTEKSETILRAVRTHLEKDYPFAVVPGDGISIMDGKDEGVYAWITTNYLLGNIGSKEQTPTAAVFDLGGGSTQIVFEPTFPVTEEMTPGDHKYDLNFGGRHFSLYQHSHLGYGLMEARKKVHALVVKNAGVTGPVAAPIINPCLPPKMTREVEVKLDSGKTIAVNMTGPAEPSTSQCRFLTEAILEKEATCDLAPCSFNGVHQPSLVRTFAKEDIFIFSYFYDRTYPLGMPHSFTLAELRDLTGKVCKGASAWSSFAAIPGALAELEDRPEWCLDLNFMVAMLNAGYDIPIEREVKIAKKIKGNELGWCLGASLPLLDQGEAGWTCKVKQIA
ncbi:nucleoside phosphatase family-domain-containing protein [Dipodascopsis tothii]|uniref:nucleoside phosphatase family-domain-containing protein n=1 Tax=Dipodascopsis tothii TaxID=44089 RepID=UPI0034CEC650